MSHPPILCARFRLIILFAQHIRFHSSVRKQCTKMNSSLDALLHKKHNTKIIPRKTQWVFTLVQRQSQLHLLLLYCHPKPLQEITNLVTYNRGTYPCSEINTSDTMVLYTHTILYVVPVKVVRVCTACCCTLTSHKTLNHEVKYISAKLIFLLMYLSNQFYFISIDCFYRCNKSLPFNKKLPLFNGVLKFQSQDSEKFGFEF